MLHAPFRFGQLPNLASSATRCRQIGGAGARDCFLLIQRVVLTFNLSPAGDASERTKNASLERVIVAVEECERNRSLMEMKDQHMPPQHQQTKVASHLQPALITVHYPGNCPHHLRNPSTIDTIVDRNNPLLGNIPHPRLLGLIRRACQGIQSRQM
jgi:hypothetical protein